MQVILLERVEKLGQMGDEVKVKDGFARNFLLPKKKALRATKANREYFQTQKAQLEASNLKAKGEAEKVGKKLDGQTFMLIRQAGDRGQLYGSVSPRDISDVITEGGFTVSRTQVPLDKAIKTIGLFPVSVVLHPEVRVSVTINVARTEEEAERQARGEDVLAERTAEEETSAEAKAAAEELFEEGAGPKTEEGEEAKEA
jgi:large subunit ribosomal protein L9